MGIFIKRPFCLFCFCFIAFSLLACALPSSIKLALLAVLLFVSALFFAFSYKTKRKYGFIQTAISLIFAALAIFESLVFIDFREDRLGALECENAAVDFVVLSEEYSSRYSSKYEGKIRAIDGEEVNERAYLVLDTESDYFAGDRLVLKGNLSLIESESSSVFKFPLDTALEITPVIEKDLFIVSDHDGFDISVICAKLRAYVKDIFVSRLDKDSAAMSFGVLTGDDSMIERQTVRDFRRAGLSHILAVSGLHLSVILGAVELLLRKLCISKGKRCVTVGFLSLFLLMLSGFSPSACRAVLMLLCAYFCYALAREPDTLTSLCTAGMIILLLSPISVGSISFWLSFLATLGIVLYAELLGDRRRRREGKGKIIRFPLVRRVFGALAVTLCANVFICVIFWLCFGEMSVISPLSNLLIAPLCEVYLILTVVVFLFGGIPFVGSALSYVAGILSAFITELAKRFSSLGFSVVSLRYAFAGIIICITTVLLAVLFIVKLRKRFIIALVPVMSALVFCVCLGVYNFVNSSVKVAYINQDERDSLVIADSGKCALIDVSDGVYSSFYNAYEWASREAFVEIESVVLTHYHARHISTLDRLFGSAMVRNLCIPAPEDLDELAVMRDIISLATDSGVAVRIYEDEKVFSVCDGFDMFKLENGKREGSERKIISFSLATRDGILTYADSSWHNADTKEDITHFVSSSDALVLGAHGPEGIIEGDLSSVKYPPVVVGANIDVLARAPLLVKSESSLLIVKGKDDIRICEFKFGGK